jgi:hypothetical protein
MQLLAEILRELHTHLRETHKKRDQLLAFYFALLAALLAYRGPPDRERAAAAMVLVIGVLVLWAMIQYRKWHMRFNGSFATLARLIADDRAVTLGSARTAWAETNDERSRLSVINPFDGVESATITLAAFAVSFALTIWLHTSGGGVPTIHNSELVATVANGLLVLFATDIVIFAMAKRFQRFPEADWMFRWLRVAE